MKTILKILIVLILVSIILKPQVGDRSLLDVLKNTSIQVLNFVNYSIVEKIRDGLCVSDDSSKSKLLNNICDKKYTPIAIDDDYNTDKPADNISQEKNIQETIPVNKTSATSKVSTLAKEISGVISETLPGIKQITPNVVATGDLNTLDIFSYTNTERSKVSGILPLSLNTNLNKIAEYRMNDMFKRGYFEHVSPLGEDVASGAGIYKYKYAVIGENIALGNFRSSNEVVQAWMASEGHRKNILNSSYEEIGISASKGMYNGTEVWIAVQVFAKPSSSCGYPDDALKTRVVSLSETQKTLYAKAEQMLLLFPSLQNDISAYNAKVLEYNSIVDSVKALTAELEPLIVQYNAQVNRFNQCISSNI